jgi:hypothetical protein
MSCKDKSQQFHNNSKQSKCKLNPFDKIHKSMAKDLRVISLV